MQQVLGFNVVSFFSTPMPTQPLGWYKNEVTGAADLQGMKFRTVGLATEVFQNMGCGGHAAAGWRDRSGHAAGRDRRLRVQQPELGPPARRARRRQELHARQLSSANESFEIIFNKDLRRAGTEQQAILKYASEAASSATLWKAFDRYSKDLIALQEEDGVTSSSRPPTSCRRSSLPGTRSPSSSRPTISSGGSSNRRGTGASGSCSTTSTTAPTISSAYEHHFGPLGF